MEGGGKEEKELREEEEVDMVQTVLRQLTLVRRLHPQSCEAASTMKEMQSLESVVKSLFNRVRSA